MWNMEIIGFTASEEKSFENVDGRTTDGRRMPAYIISSLSLLLLYTEAWSYEFQMILVPG